MLAAPMPCSANTRAAASNNFSRVSSRVGRVRTLDMRGKSIILQFDTLLYRVAQGSSHADRNHPPRGAADLQGPVRRVPEDGPCRAADAAAYLHPARVGDAADRAVSGPRCIQPTWGSPVR